VGAILRVACNRLERADMTLSGNVKISAKFALVGRYGLCQSWGGTRAACACASFVPRHENYTISHPFCTTETSSRKEVPISIMGACFYVFFSYQRTFFASAYATLFRCQFLLGSNFSFVCAFFESSGFLVSCFRSRSLPGAFLGRKHSKSIAEKSKAP